MNSQARAILASEPAQGSAWDLAPLPPELARELRAVLAKLDQGQRWWLAGWLAGSAPAVNFPGPASAPAFAAATSAGAAVTVLFGSHTGNSERLARRIAESLSARGVRHQLIDMLECRKAHLQESRTLLIVVSTHGDGEPPERAAPLFELLHSRKAPRLDHLHYAVLALGDSSYEKFCETGRQFDARLEALGATRFHARVDCDVDFESPAQRWIDGIVERLEAPPVDGAAGAAPPTTGHAAVSPAGAWPASVATAYTRKNPFRAPVLANLRLTAAGSTKDVRHVELSIEGANLHYEPGDALGIVARNRTSDVDALLDALRFEPQASVSAAADGTTSLREALAERHDIGPIQPAFLRRYAQAIRSAPLEARIRGDAPSLARYLRGRALLDLVAEHGTADLGPKEFAALLPPLAPRLYSIASSQRATPDEIHLTVAVVEYAALGRARRGLVSGLLADATGEEASLPVYLHRNPGFRLPANAAAPIVMIGPGTGVAPFRAFVAEREAQGAKGRNWLFFGDRSFETDFLYQAEWIDWRKRGTLSRVDVAFSRDGAQKTYVQHRLAARGAELWRWLEEGAYLYVCGDAEQMAPDVHRTLLEIIARHGGRSIEQAGEYLLDLQRVRRYQRDVY